jgi:hypothetical protein
MSGECAHSPRLHSVVGSSGYEISGERMSVIAVPFHPVFGALWRARHPILWMGLTYLLSVAVGVIMVHSHSDMALSRRDLIVGRAVASDPVMATSQRGFPVRAALLDFAGNLGRGAIPTTIMGLAVVMPFPVAAYRGWVGGIVVCENGARGFTTLVFCCCN